MVNFQQLNSAQPGLWIEAATDWAELGADIQTRSGELSRGTGDPLKDGWKGAAAETARGRIIQSVHGLQAAAVEVAVIGEILKGLGESLRLAQGMLNDGRDLAAKAGLLIDADGKITVPSGKADSAQAKQAVALIRQAIQEATAIDAEAARWLKQKATRTWVDDPAEASDSDGMDGSRTELDLIRRAIPKGPPEVVSAWWKSLSPAEQQRLMLAAPDKIGTLDGIPDSVKAQIDGDSGLNRIALIQFAIKNWDNGDIDTHGDNCTTFVSQALAAAGLTENTDWGSAPLTNIKGLDVHTRTDSWAQAEGLHRFLTNNDGASSIPPSQTQPGDIIFFQDSKQGIHHAAIVTSVVDGHIYYTQHSNPAQNTDWNYRSTVYNETYDAQTPIIVRPQERPSTLPHPYEPR